MEGHEYYFRYDSSCSVWMILLDFKEAGPWVWPDCDRAQGVSGRGTQSMWDEANNVLRQRDQQWGKGQILTAFTRTNGDEMHWIWGLRRTESNAFIKSPNLKEWFELILIFYIKGSEIIPSAIPYLTISRSALFFVFYRGQAVRAELWSWTCALNSQELSWAAEKLWSTMQNHAPTPWVPSPGCAHSDQIHKLHVPSCISRDTVCSWHMWHWPWCHWCGQRADGPLHLSHSCATRKQSQSLYLAYHMHTFVLSLSFQVVSPDPGRNLQVIYENSMTSQIQTML